MSEIKRKTEEGNEVTFRKEGNKLIAEIEAPEGFKLEALSKKLDADEALGSSCSCRGGFIKALGGFF